MSGGAKRGNSSDVGRMSPSRGKGALFGAAVCRQGTFRQTLPFRGDEREEAPHHSGRPLSHRWRPFVALCRPDDSLGGSPTPGEGTDEGAADGCSREDCPEVQRVRAAVNIAKHELGERGPVWWMDGDPDLTGKMVQRTVYAAWFEYQNEERNQVPFDPLSLPDGEPGP